MYSFPQRTGCSSRTIWFNCIPPWVFDGCQIREAICQKLYSIQRSGIVEMECQRWFGLIVSTVQGLDDLRLIDGCARLSGSVRIVRFRFVAAGSDGTAFS